jgi:hypothetical protein
LYDELDTIIEKNEEQRPVMDPSSEHGFDTYNFTHMKEVPMPKVVQIDLLLPSSASPLPE